MQYVFGLYGFFFINKESDTFGAQAVIFLSHFSLGDNNDLSYETCSLVSITKRHTKTDRWLTDWTVFGDVILQQQDSQGKKQISLNYYAHN